MTDLVIYLARIRIARSLIAGGVVSALALSGCVGSDSSSDLAPILSDSATPSPTASPTVAASPQTVDILQQSWEAYRQRFIQADGRVIDREARDRSTSEGQAYAMLRAVLVDDPATFALTLQWAEENLRRDAQGDSLWCWKWGEIAEGEWGIQDANFASDGDLDAITALILAARRWNRPDYLELARVKLVDLWNLSTIEVAGRWRPLPGGQTRYFLPGPKQAFHPNPTSIYLNPSYLAPYAFRLFAQVDPDRDWLSLIDSSYDILNQSAEISAVGLPSDWVVLDPTTGRFQPMSPPSQLRSLYGFDAYRVWWRVSIDAEWFNEPRAHAYLSQHLQPLQAMWRSRRMIPAQIDLQGQPLVNYESTAQYAMLYAGFRQVDPAIAAEIRQQKLMSTYQNGFWDSDIAYYTQNLAWFALISPSEIAATWQQP